MARYICSPIYKMVRIKTRSVYIIIQQEYLKLNTKAVVFILLNETAVLQ